MPSKSQRGKPANKKKREKSKTVVEVKKPPATQQWIPEEPAEKYNSSIIHQKTKKSYMVGKTD